MITPDLEPRIQYFELPDGAEYQSSAFCTYGNCYAFSERDANPEDDTEQGIQVDIYNSSRLDEQRNPEYVTSVPVLQFASFVEQTKAAFQEKQREQLDLSTILDLLSGLLPSREHRERFSYEETMFLFKSIKAGEFDQYLEDLRSARQNGAPLRSGSLVVRELVSV